LFPELDPARQNPGAIAEMTQLLAFKARIAQAIDAAQQSGAIGSPLEVRVVASVADAPLLELLRRRASEIEELFILSHLEIAEGAEEAVAVDKTARAKCERCWRHRPDVGREPAHPMLCGRCAEAVIA
jgi:isoleucyl-tRNA synthetase